MWGPGSTDPPNKSKIRQKTNNQGWFIQWPFTCLTHLGSFLCFLPFCSSLSSSINSLCAVVWDDILKEHFASWQEDRKTLNKLLCKSSGSAAFGVGCVFW